MAELEDAPKRSQVLAQLEHVCRTHRTLVERLGHRPDERRALEYRDAASKPQRITLDATFAIGVEKIRRTLIIECPVYAPDGTLQTIYGYHPASQTFCALPDGLAIEPVLERPTAADLERAKALILDEQLVDFPFVSQADRANAVGLALDPYVRDLIVGPTPLRLIEAPTPGVGKGLLTDALLRPSCGRSVGVIAQARDDDEWRKRISACLRDGLDQLGDFDRRALSTVLRELADLYVPRSPRPAVSSGTFPKRRSSLRPPELASSAAASSTLASSSRSAWP